MMSTNDDTSDELHDSSDEDTENREVDLEKVHEAVRRRRKELADETDSTEEEEESDA